MGLTVSNQIDVSLAIDGQEVPIGLESFQRFEMIENVAIKLPTIEFEMNDPYNYLHDSAPLVDGSIITASLHSDNGYDYGQKETTDYLTQGVQIGLNGASLHYTVNGVYNAPKYLAGNPSKSYKGTSDDVLGQLIGECGLKLTKADGANDSQPWLPTRQTYHDFIRSIVDHGYVDDKSIMSHGVTSQGEVIYKNLTTLAQQSGSRVVTTGSPDLITQGVIPCVSWRVLNMAGMSNMLYNYGLKLVQEKMTGSAESFDKYTGTMFSEFLNIGKSVSDAIGGFVRSEYLPHDMGNQHDKYYQAEYNNRRGKQLFSCKIEFTTYNSTGLKLYDVIEFQPVLPTNNQVSTLLKGNYIVTAKKKWISGNNYVETIEAMSQGFGANAGGGLEAG